MLRLVFWIAMVLPGCLGRGDGTPLFDDVQVPFSDTEEAAPEMYRYQTPDGRWAFTGNLDMVPPSQRPEAQAVDLSGVSLNTELGNSIRDSMIAQHRRLTEEAGCTAEERTADPTSWRARAERHVPALAIAACALLVLLSFPLARRQVNPIFAGRLLTFVVPILAFLSVMTYGLTESGVIVARMRDKTELCNEQSFAAAPAREQAERLEQLDAMLAREGATYTTRP